MERTLLLEKLGLLENALEGVEQISPAEALQALRAALAELRQAWELAAQEAAAQEAAAQEAAAASEALTEAEQEVPAAEAELGAEDLTLVRSLGTLGNIGDGIFAVDQDWRIVYINEQAAARAQLLSRDLVGRVLWDRFPMLAGTMIEKLYRGVMETRQAARFETQGLATSTWYAINVYPNRAGIVIHWQDITERKENERALREHTDELREQAVRLRVALASAPVSVFGMDTDLRYTWAFGPAMGMIADDFIGRSDDELLPDGQAEELTAFKRSVLKSSVGMRGEFQFTIDNKKTVLLVYAEASRDTENRVTGITGAALDISEQRQLEAERVSYLSSVEVQRRLLDQREMERLKIARDLHDGPLQNMVGLLFNIQRAVEESDCPSASTVLHAAQASLRGMVDELRGVCNDLRPPTLMLLGLERAIRNHAGQFRQRYPELTLYLDLMDDRGQLSDAMRLALYRIYQEGLSNVVMHSRATQAVVHFSLDDERVTLQIEDNGSGLDAPVDWLNLARGGHLGLAGMKERTEAIGGIISVSPVGKKGMVVRVEAPLSPQPPLT